MPPSPASSRPPLPAAASATPTTPSIANATTKTTAMPPPPPTPDDGQQQQQQQQQQQPLPKGQCRYILMVPELKGQRCGCTGFDHNKSMPGATCHCGHLSCFHLASDGPSPSQNKEEIDAVNQRVHVLEEHVQNNQHDRFCNVVGRVSELEETVDKYHDEAMAEIKGSYRNICAAWQMVEQLQKRMKILEDLYQAQSERLMTADKTIQDLHNRQLELFDSDESLEERIEKLENSELLSNTQDRDQDSDRRASMSRSRRPSSIIFHEHFRPLTSTLTTAAVVPQPSVSSLASLSAGWTVHISLMPFKEQPFPFEKDTVAYKRCLSRGLHRMVAVEGPDAESFVRAVNRSFESLLRGREWMPLQAKLCDAEKLQGLPMLRQLDPRLVHGRYDMNFLREHCAVCTPNGKMDSLYITMVHDTLSWNFLNRSPVYLEGLESAWDHDVFLDQKEGSDSANIIEVFGEKDEGSPSAGDIVAPFTSLKRSVSEVSCSSILEDSETSRKMARTCKSGMMEVRRGVETAR